MSDPDLGELQQIADRFEKRGYERAVAELTHKIDEAYFLGWEHCQRAVREAMETVPPPPAALAHRLESTPYSQIASLFAAGGPAAAAAAQAAATVLNSIHVTQRRAPRSAILKGVLEIIRQRPGLQGIEVAGTACNEGITDKERSVRTALRRLRIRGYIHQTEGRWYPFAGTGEPSEADAEGLENEAED